MCDSRSHAIPAVLVASLAVPATLAAQRAPDAGASFVNRASATDATTALLEPTGPHLVGTVTDHRSSTTRAGSRRRPTRTI